MFHMKHRKEQPVKITTAIETLALLRDVFIPRLLLADKHQQELVDAINLAISALKTIQDGNFILKGDKK